MTTLARTLAATYSTDSGAENLTADRGVAEPGTNDALPVDGGRTRTATATTSAAKNIAAAPTRIMNVTARTMLRRSADIAGTG